MEEGKRGKEKTNEGRKKLRKERGEEKMEEEKMRWKMGA